MRYLKMFPAIVSAGLLLFGAGEVNAQAAHPAPSNATALCKDGTYSKSAHRTGTCSYHGGVVTWLRGPGGQ